MKFEKLLSKLGLNIKLIRDKNNLSQKDFSKITGLDQSFLSKVENGKSNITIDYLRKIAKGLRVPVSVLFKNI